VDRPLTLLSDAERDAGRGSGRDAGRGMGMLDVMRPKVLAVRRRASGEGGTFRAVVLGGVGVIFWLMMFAILYRMLVYFRSAEGIGEVLAVKLLSIILLSFLAILLLSNVIAALSSFFLARDLELLMASPMDPLKVYAARLTETMTYSSWMVMLMMVPILTAYGIVYDGALVFIAVSILALAAFFLIPAVAGSAITLLLVNVFPARRARDLLALMGLFAAAGVVLLFRLLRPEQIMRPEGFHSLVDFVATLQTPASVWLPSEWAAEAIMAPLRSGSTDWFALLLLVSTAAGMSVVGAFLHGRYFADGFSRAQEGASLNVSTTTAGRPLLDRLLGRLSPPTRALVVKDIRSFFRDTTQWSQLILLAVLVVVYVYNIKVLPIFTGPDLSFLLVNVISFLNLGLAGFVLAAIAARFLFPAVSLEGRTIWLLRSSPLMLRRLIWSKYWVNLVPLLLVAIGLTAGTNYILRVGPFMMILSLVTIAVMTFAIAALALGFGALFPRFDSANAADIPTGFGGLLFMMTAVGYLAAVIVLQAWPVYAVLSARVSGAPLDAGAVVWLVVGLGASGLISALAIVLPLRAAVRRVGEVEI
jgi:ABC-2 type transport system permease protein